MNSLLLDANCVIYLNEIGKWDQFIKQNHVFIPTIIEQEAQYFYDKAEDRHYIIFGDSVKEGLVKIVDMDVSELVVTRDKIRAILRDMEIDEGELQAISFLLQEDWKGTLFCTADRLAIVACCVLGIENICVSLETALEKSGMKTPVRHEYTEAFMNEWKKRGWIKKIQNTKLQ